MGVSTLGLDPDVVDDSGATVVDVPGHLICRNEWPGRAFDIASDRGGLVAYYERFGVWDQQDLGQHGVAGDWFVLGRSDEVMKIAGRRVGPSDVENAALRVKGVSACVSAPMTIDGTSKLICLLVLGDDATPAVVAAVADAVAAGLGKAFRPAWVGAVTGPPLTSSGKLNRGVLRRWMLEMSADVSDANSGIIHLTDGLAARNAGGWSDITA
jgi:acetyl-CoA synthetase